MIMQHQPIICLMGPTASGKTSLILKIADEFPIDIISVDSAMIYRGMDIGTAKPERAVLEKYPHYLVDICDPRESYSVGDFCRDTTLQIEKSIAANRYPILVGGTMMYFRALERGLSELPPANLDIRAQLEQKAKQKGWDFLHAELAKIDETAAKRIHANDKQRISRALEVYYVSGKSISEFQLMTVKQSIYTYRWLALFPDDRALLHSAIAVRFQEMLAQGLIEEVQTLYTRGDLSPALPSMRSVNYRQVWEYLAGQVTRDEMTEKAIAATRQLAKRQMTWLRSFEALQVLNADNAFDEMRFLLNAR